MPGTPVSPPIAASRTVELAVTGTLGADPGSHRQAEFNEYSVQLVRTGR